MKITDFNRHEAATFNAALQAALKKVCEDYGVTHDPIRYRYGAGSFNTAINFKSESGKAVDTGMFKLMCERHGFDPDRVSRDGYRLIGYNANRPKNCWSIKGPNGKTYITSTAWCNSRFKTLATPPARPSFTPSVTSHVPDFPAGDAPSATAPARSYDSSF